ncbi:hypothetical protein SAMN04489760_10226 [Syntrophus gentianae]|uniref:Uncharacterized protein n=1 Tax=Syntrophus gentianae TaxID=43775 RepID=A0A1H7UQR8_9BACT|nr:hypothetical protein [Syntrophus gentianae]SEL98998.1 hypothetical protein SAMN04489760_10226 [Syntrophus gentianae]
MKNAFENPFRKIGELWRKGKTGGARRTGETSPSRDGFRGFLAGIGLTGLFALLLVFPLSASAHPPSDVQLSYLEKEQTLQITISHNSIFPSSHYVKQVEIQKNGEKPTIYEYKSQPDKTKFSYVYKMPLKEGDRVEVRVVCSVYGSRTVSLVLPGPAAK